MAYLQSDLPPSTAPVKAAAAPAARAPSPRASEALPQRWSKLLVRGCAVIFGAALLAIPGYAAARATESLAIGILAADFAFLIGVAAWSTIARSARR